MWELPLCPVCLERVDAAALGFQTHLFGWDGSPELLTNRRNSHLHSSDCKRYSCSKTGESGLRCASFAERAAAAAAVAGCATCRALLSVHSDFYEPGGLKQTHIGKGCSERRSRSCGDFFGSAVAAVSADECTARRRKISEDSRKNSFGSVHCRRRPGGGTASRHSRFVVTHGDQEALRLRCQVCFEAEDLWLCLVCGHSGE